jgi:hypothetical protein
MYARDLSTRESPMRASVITERLWAAYEASASRDLCEFTVVYPFIEGIVERLHLGQPREAVLAAWGILADGRHVLLRSLPHRENGARHAGRRDCVANLG